MSNELAERLEAAAHSMEAWRFHSTASLLREAARAIREAGWQSVETAPKEVDVHVFADGERIVAMLVDGDWLDTESRTVYGVSHWAPLPPAPTPDQEPRQ